MTSLPANTNPALPAPAGAAVVPGMSAIGTPAAPAAPVAPAVPGATSTGGGATPAVDPAQLLILLTTLLTLLQSQPGVQGAQAGAAGVQGGGGTAVPVSGASFAPTTMNSLGAVGASAIDTNIGGGGGRNGSTVGGVVLNGATGTSTSLSNGTVPSVLPSLGTIMGGVGGGGGAAAAPGAGAHFEPTTMGSFNAISASSPATTNIYGSAGFGSSTVGGFVLGAQGNNVQGGGAAAAPAATPQIDQRRMTGSPQSGGVIDTILRSATAMAGPSKSEGTYIVIQDVNGAQLQAHVHGAWSSHPTRIQEGIQRGYIQVHVHEDGTLHLHDVI